MSILLASHIPLPASGRDHRVPGAPGGPSSPREEPRGRRPGRLIRPRGFAAVAAAFLPVLVAAACAGGSSSPDPAGSAAPSSPSAGAREEKAPPSTAGDGNAEGTAPGSKAEAKEEPPAGDPGAPEPEKESTITLLDGSKVTMRFFPNPSWPGKIVRFEPHLPSSDVNLFNAALNSMWEVYGRQRGAFRREDGMLTPRKDLGTSIMVYKLKTGARFCVLAVRDDKEKTLTAIKVWLE